MASKQPAIYLLGFVVTGILFANLSNLVPFWLFAVGFLFSLTGLILFAREQRQLAAVALMICLGFLSAFHFSLRYLHPGQHDLGEQIESRSIVRVFGEVSDWPDIRANRIELRIETDSILKDGLIIQTSGALLLKISDTSNVLQRGDRVDFRGRLYPLSNIRSSSSFDYGRYLNLKGVRAIVYLPTALDIRLDRRNRLGLNSLVDQLRSAIVQALNQDLEPTQAALARGFLIGETRDIPRSVYEMFRDSGTLHLLAVSGSNVSLVLLFIHFMLRPFKIKGRRKSYLLLIVVLLFTQLAYGEPSVVRAAVMASLIILARIFERRYDLNHIIATAALAILLFDPAQLFDVGFQLSFVTAWGLILTGPILTKYFGHHLHRWYGWVITLVLMSLAAQVFSTPIIAYHFERIPAISVLANLVIIPLVSVGVIGILALLVAHLILPLLGLFVGSLVNPLLKLVVSALDWLGGENMLVFKTGSLMSGPAAPWLIALIYLVLVMAVLAVYQKSIRRRAIIVGLVVMNITLIALVTKSMSVEGQAVRINALPGGVVVAIPSEGEAVDLVISGCRSGSFSVGEMILTPWLDRHDISRVNRIFLINVDYDCLPSLLEFATKSRVAGLYLPETIKPLLVDHIGLLDVPPAWDWDLIPTRSTVSGELGYSLIDEGFLINRLDQPILISRLVPEKLLTAHDRLGPFIPGLCLIYPHKWRADPAIFGRLDRSGLTPIICSEIAQQYPPEVDRAEISPDLILPEFVIDLKQTGPVKLVRPEI